MSTHIWVMALIRQTNDKMLKMKKSLIFCMLLFCAVAASAQTNIRKGSSAYGNVLYNWDGKNLRQGSSVYGPVIANWDGENIRQGSSPYDKVIYNWDGKNLRQGTSPYGSILYNWDGANIRKGSSAYGSVIYIILMERVFVPELVHTGLCCTILTANYRLPC